MSKDNYSSFDCELKDETDKAYLVVIDDEDYWVPKSICTLDLSSNKVDGELNVQTWWAEKEHLA